MSGYWLIKVLLIVALAGVTYFLIRPSRSASSLALRRIGMLLVLAAAVFAILFPSLFNTFARAVGVSNGTNLLVYLLTIALFAQMASSYRRDSGLDRKLSVLAREVALNRESAQRSAPSRSSDPTIDVAPPGMDPDAADSPDANSAIALDQDRRTPEEARPSTDQDPAH